MANGIYFEEKKNNIWQPRGQFILDKEGNIIITNGKDYPKIGNPTTGTQTVYHFNTDTNDSEGGNKENIICEGNIISDDAPVSSNYFDGKIRIDLSKKKSCLVFNKSNIVCLCNDAIFSLDTFNTEIRILNHIRRAVMKTNCGLTQEQKNNMKYKYNFIKKE